MATEFQDLSTRHRPLQMWQILISYASNRQTVRYGSLAEMMGYAMAPPIFGFLDRLAQFCVDNNLPILPVIVCNENTGIPGSGILEYVEDVSSEREIVFDYDWFGIFPPEPRDFD